ncbi:MAG: hypothetical protein JEZ07_14180 [Phycisphaerae bacterium]|nr:hypothetical protein [Phycisphaerae bacterium]
MSLDPVNPDRGIDSIAHLFLSRADKNNIKPRRVPPVQNSKAPEPQDVVELSDDVQESQLEPRALGEIILAGHLQDYLHKARLYAHYLLERDENIALLSIGQSHVHAVTINKENDEDPQPQVIAETEDIEKGLMPALAEFSSHYDNLLLLIEPSFMPRLPELLGNFEHMTILSTVGSHDLVESYKAIKAVAGHIDPQQQVSLFVCEAPNSDAADDVYYKLADTARSHLGITLIPAGCHIEKIEPISSTPIDSEIFDPEIQPVDPKLNDLIANNSFVPEYFPEMNLKTPGQDFQPPEPSEYDDSNLDFVDFDLPIENILAQEPQPSIAPEEIDTEKTHNNINQPQQEPAMPVIQAQTSIKHAYYPLNLDKLPQDDQQLNQSLLLNLSAWLTSLPGAIALPTSIPVLNSQNFKLLVDQAGKLHVMTATLSVKHDTLINSLNALGWVNDNLQLIVNSCPQLSINNTAEVGLVVVAGDNVTELKQAARQLSNPASIYQLHLLTGQTDSILIIPA